MYIIYIYMAKGSNIIKFRFCKLNDALDYSSTEVLVAIIYSLSRRVHQQLSEASDCITNQV